MATGTTSTTVTANWTAVKNANGFPTVVSGDDVEIFANRSTPPFSGEAWSDIDTMDPIPAGATITDMTFELTVQVNGSRQTSTIPIGPSLQFIDKAEYLAGTFGFGYGLFGVGGAGEIPNDNLAHDITYDNNTYGEVSFGGGVPHVDAFAAALSDSSTPVILAVTGPQNASNGTGLWYRAPLTLTFFWTTPGGAIPPQRLSNRTAEGRSLTHAGLYQQGGQRLTGAL